MPKHRSEIRARCRARWGKDWHRVHPAIKKARMTWASGGDVEGRKVIVIDGGDTYVA